MNRSALARDNRRALKIAILRSNRVMQIGPRLNVSHTTVQRHVRKLCLSYGARNIFELTGMLYRQFLNQRWKNGKLPPRKDRKLSEILTESEVAIALLLRQGRENKDIGTIRGNRREKYIVRDIKKIHDKTGTLTKMELIRYLELACFYDDHEAEKKK